MNKMRKIALLSIVCSLILVSCNNVATTTTSLEDDNSLKKMDLKGNVKTSKEASFELLPDGSKGGKTFEATPDSYSLFNEKGFITKKQVFGPDGNVSATYLYEYNEDNQLTKETRYSATENIDKVYTYAYGADSKSLETQTTYTALGNIESSDKFSVENGLITKQESFDALGNPVYYWSYEYDEKGNRNKATWHINNVCIQNVYSYNNNDKLIEQTEINESNISTRWKFAYDDKGNITEETSIYSDGSEVKRTYTYEYDKQGNWTKKTARENGNPLYVSERTIEYY
jgi:hypothetical protein